jgi:hypothetical protein
MAAVCNYYAIKDKLQRGWSWWYGFLIDKSDVLFCFVSIGNTTSIYIVQIIIVWHVCIRILTIILSKKNINLYVDDDLLEATH